MSSGIAGRTNYSDWDKKVSDLVDQTEEDEAREKEEAEKALGLCGKYAHSKADAEERQKAQEVKQAKEVLDGYRKREGANMQAFDKVFDSSKAEEGKATDASIVRLTRDAMDAGKRVVTICDTTGSSQKDTIVLTQDLSHLESKMNATAPVVPKDFSEDADNGVKEQPQQRTIYGLIKLFISNVHNCTIVVRCKLITGSVELSHCSNVTLKIEKEATVATLQADLCEDICVEFHDAPSGKNISGQAKLYWGEDKDDRIFHAGVKQMRVAVVRDGFVETECMCDYLKDGALVVGNASAEEHQSVTSVVDGELKTEQVVRHGATTGKNARAMTQRELDRENETREKAAKMAVAMAEDMIKIVDKDGKEVVKKEVVQPVEQPVEEVEEFYASMSKTEIDHIVADCEQNKTRGNEAFGAGEYGQAILLYTLALDKADELPDKGNKGGKQIFPRHIVLSNRSAAFLKLGDHEKALVDGTKAQETEPTYVKGIFRRGLALHAMGRYQDAIESLAAAHKIEPKNKQIKQALQFAEVRMTQEMRKRMGEK
mmetsp:Transcript_471/g.756  ORF Transcript_471/g.756 Transcript_471/m.756 type:complete len:542 (-) Transcript_471:38-1663(-)|eukprot:CAMPEP_0119012808 /NCGR_PEP_ID=MMETSP1176-20130426/7632_1 /TAXON_ID=265551 /ORGANISM="Synedropsis recta cf, Strain CCMP1620" /LENGTH=541 /DNA_ID=CAMNT_0006965837 /DNA_START=69 /DNA_END=1694 /DNA_ORIENTATION=-